STPTPTAPANQVAQPVETATPVADKPASLPPPKPDEVKKAVTRVFQQVATLDVAHSPSFVVGDFNGDGSEDLAVSVTPNEGMLIEINNELANWIFEDPKKVSIPGKTPAARGPPPIRCEPEPRRETHFWQSFTAMARRDGATRRPGKPTC